MATSRPRGGGGREVDARVDVAVSTGRAGQRRGADARAAQVAEERPEDGGGYAALQRCINVCAPARQVVAVSAVAAAVVAGGCCVETLQHLFCLR